MGIFITGTDTGVGKTRVAAMLIRELRARGVDAVGFKPICCGDRADAEALVTASGGGIEINDANPVWLRAPLAPHAAAMVEGRVVDVALVRETFARLRAGHAEVVVEGVGGWLVPVARELTMADLAVEFALPVLVVAANRLGAINHTLLTVRAVRDAGLRCTGVILNGNTSAAADVAAMTNAAVIEEFLAADGVSVCEMAFGAERLPLGVMEMACGKL